MKEFIRTARHGLLLGLLATGCGPAEPAQQLVAVGQLLDAHGAPVAGAQIGSYQLFFTVDADVEIARTFREDIEQGAHGIVTDELGMFRISASDLRLSYDWQQDEYVCGDVCIESETQCYEVEEDVCVEQCEVVSYEDCYDECYDDCGTSCYDETTCTTYEDDAGNVWEDCVTETICEDDCTSTCEPVCGTVTEEQCWDDCQIEVYEQCDEECIQYEEQCDWVTHTYTSYPELSEIVATRAVISLHDEREVEQRIEGDELEAREEQECSKEHGASQCRSLNVWLQRDRFTLPSSDRTRD